METIDALSNYVEKYADPNTVYKCKEFYNAFVEWNCARTAHQSTIQKLCGELTTKYIQKGPF